MIDLLTVYLTMGRITGEKNSRTDYGNQTMNTIYWKCLYLFNMFK